MSTALALATLTAVESTLTGAATAQTRDYQRLKAKVHQELLNRLNLERLTRVKREDAEPEIRRVIAVIIEAQLSTTPLSLLERETLVTDVLNELFGLGPLEALLRDPAVSDILVNRHDLIFVEREGKLEETTSSSRTTVTSCKSLSASSVPSVVALMNPARW